MKIGGKSFMKRLKILLSSYILKKGMKGIEN